MEFVHYAWYTLQVENEHEKIQFTISIKTIKYCFRKLSGKTKQNVHQKQKKTKKHTHIHKTEKNNPNTRTLEAELISMFGVNDCKIRKNNR